MRVAGLFNKQRKDLELENEIESHLQMHIEDNLRLGMSSGEARRQALIKFGGIESTKDAYREQRGLPLLETLWQDIRYGARVLWKNPGFTSVAVLTVGLGIGANTALFTVINTLLLRSLPVKNPEELVQVVTSSGSPPLSYAFAYPLYRRLQEGTHFLSGLFAASGVGLKDRLIIPTGGHAEPEFVSAQVVSDNFFSVLGVSASLGRTMTTNDDRLGDPQAIVVISHRFWQRRFGSDPSVIGKSIIFNDVPFTIVGVTPPGFFGFQPGENPELWWPLEMVPQVDGDRERLTDSSNWLRLVGRLSAGAERRQAETELSVLYQHYREEYAGTRAMDWSTEHRRGFFAQKLQLNSGHAGWSKLRQQFRLPLLVLMEVVAVVLLIACANVASLLLARAAARRREFSVRSALGAGRFRLVRQLVTESLMLSALSGLLGFLLACAGTRALQPLLGLPTDPVSLSLAPDARVLLFTVTASLLSGLLFGLTPALWSSRLDLASALKGASASVAGGGLRQRPLQALVLVQVALSLVLLVGAGLFFRTLRNLNGVDAGFNRENIVLFNIDFAQRPDTAHRDAFYRELLARIETVPGVRTATLFNYGLLSGVSMSQNVTVEGYVAEPGENLECAGTLVGPEFFQTFGTPVLLGRDFGPQDEQLARSADTNAPRSVIINQAMARRYFGERNPVGGRFSFTQQATKRFEIVGVVADEKYGSLREPSPPLFYLPGPNGDWVNFALRTSVNPGSVLASLPGVVRQMDPTIRVRDLRTMSDVVNASVHQERLLTQLGGFFSLVSLALACLGLFGVLSFAVAQRTREIGVRMALGAQKRDVLFLVIRSGLKLALVGSAIGLVGAAAATRVVSNLLYGVNATDPTTFCVVVLGLLSVALFASWLPAWRAAKVDPMVALRYE
jgi:predicted permease